MEKPSVLVVIGDGFKQVEQMFKKEGWNLTSDIDEADLVQFVGGADVTPFLYNHHTHDTTHADRTRDEKEQYIFAMALDRGIPMAGICRGGQFLNVMNGGTMYQDVDGHNTGIHDAYLTGSMVPIPVTSTHHQMMAPNWTKDADVKLLLVAAISTRKIHMSNIDTGVYPINTRRTTDTRTDVEAVYYPGTRSLCFQPHPEYDDSEHTTTIYFRFLEQYLFGEEVVEQEQQA